VKVDPEVARHLIDDLAKQHYCIYPNAVPTALTAGLRETFRERRAQFRPAKIGRTGEAAKNTKIRNDEICWINETDLRTTEAHLFQFFEALRLELNRELFLGLTDFEAHYARYDKGHFYARHIDRFQADGARQISAVLYLNENWSPSDGGVLRLYANNLVNSMTPTSVDVEPVGGTLVCFTSAEIEHEVLPANRERMSVAAWFRRT
jgi:SM-20-related protein